MTSIPIIINMRKLIFILGIIFIILTFATLIIQTASIHNFTPIEEGYLDLSEKSYDEIETVLLQGEWEFYPQMLLTPDELSHISSPEEYGGGYIQVPSQWISYESMTRRGMGTYRIKVDLPSSGYYALAMKSVYTSFELFVNGESLLEIGTVGMGESTNNPQFKPATTTFYTDEASADIIFHIGNFDHRKGGLVQDIVFGTPDEIRHLFLVENTFNVFLAGILFMMGIFLLTFFGKSNRDVGILYFGFFCLIISLRTVFNNTIPILQLFPNFPFALEMKLEYLTIPLGVLTFALYSQASFSKILHEKVTSVIAIICGLYAVLILVTSTLVYNIFLNAFDALIAIYAVYWMFMMLKAWFKDHQSTSTIVLGGFILAISVLNEILFYTSPSFSSFLTYNLIPFGMFFFVITHSFDFSHRYLEALQISKDLTEELERKVYLRTNELNQANERLLLMATTDELTGLWNRNELQRKAQAEASTFSPDIATSFSVLYMDLDNFKYYNDTYSHETGDMVLKEFAQVLQSFCYNRTSAFRLGGDEFVMFLPACDKEGATVRASHILERFPEMNKKIQESLQLNSSTLIDIPQRHHITCSIGIATHYKQKIDIDNLIRHADEALLSAKTSGKNRYVVKD